ncbi:MAG TPA: hypothetical protein VGM23_12925, partial [Armatimonadota bacterium]
MLKQFRSLRWLVGGIYFLIMVCILGALALYYSHSIEEQYVSTLKEKVEGQARLGADMLAPILDKRDQEKGALLAQNIRPQARKYDVTDHELQALLTKIRFRAGVRSSVILLEINGSVISEVPPSGGAPRDETQQPEVQQALFNEKNRIGSDIRYVPKQGEEFLFLAVPVIVRQNKNAQPDNTLPPEETPSSSNREKFVGVPSIARQ